MTVRAGALALALALVSCACAVSPPAARRPAPLPPPVPLPLATPAGHDEPALAGIVHVVRRGETIYRIARTYGIDPADLMETNGIADAHAVAVGAELFVPGATRVLEVPEGPSAPAGGSTTRAPTPMPMPAATSTAAETAGSPAHPSPPLTRGEGQSRDPAPLPASTARDDHGAPLAWPLKGVLYGRYGVRGGARHDGLDIAAPEGTPVLAAGAGTVIYAGEQAGYGAVVILKHARGLVTVYAHNSRLLVEVGAEVARGQPIARVGQTGKTTGPHLHFEVRDGTRPRNPLLYLP